MPRKLDNAEVKLPDDRGRRYTHPPKMAPWGKKIVDRGRRSSHAEAQAPKEPLLYHFPGIRTAERTCPARLGSYAERVRAPGWFLSEEHGPPFKCGKSGAAS